MKHTVRAWWCCRSCVYFQYHSAIWRHSRRARLHHNVEHSGSVHEPALRPVPANSAERPGAYVVRIVWEQQTFWNRKNVLKSDTIVMRWMQVHIWYIFLIPHMYLQTVLNWRTVFWHCPDQQVLKDMFLRVSMPHKVTLGEHLQMNVVLHNRLTEGMTGVHVTLTHVSISSVQLYTCCSHTWSWTSWRTLNESCMCTILYKGVTYLSRVTFIGWPRPMLWPWRAAHASSKRRTGVASSRQLDLHDHTRRRASRHDCGA